MYDKRLGFPFFVIKKKLEQIWWISPLVVFFGGGEGKGRGG